MKRAWSKCPYSFYITMKFYFILFIAKKHEHDFFTLDPGSSSKIFLYQSNNCILQMELSRSLYSSPRSRREENVISPRCRRGVARCFLCANVEQESKMDRSHKHIL